ncbi:hypothetical protein ABZZ04_33315 [Streptomyces sp. NPDC006435]|uniref:hypothetical protein n=1 Tax=Streptomyces sp. NPDC006435 TaxID=3154300 RepID=UPI0033B90B86
MPRSRQVRSLAGAWRIDRLVDEAPADAWQPLSCGNRAKGLRVYDRAAAKLPADIAFGPDPPSRHRRVPTRRSLSDPGEIACCLAHPPVGFETGEPARATGSGRAVEECFQAPKNEYDPNEYEARRHTGWYRRITPAVLAHAALAAPAARAGDEPAKRAADRTGSDRSRQERIEDPPDRRP